MAKARIPKPALQIDERIFDRLIEVEMESSFLEYSVHSIAHRALPDARDGLKPVHRRILQAMSDEGVWPGKPHKKSAAIVGTTLGRYHPHGDSAVYDAMVRMAQSFSLRVPLVDGQGNFGSVDGDPAAAYRYTEARMAPPAGELLADIERDTVDFRPNFDGRHKEPVVLPSRLPNLLLNGSDGIAVGMATHIPPHNLRELGEAIALLCENPAVGEDELVATVQGPDFPTGGVLIRDAEVDSYLRKGSGKLKIRARMHVEYDEQGRSRLVATEIPYGVNKASLVEEIAGLVKEARMAKEPRRLSKRASPPLPWHEWIADLRDESDRQGMRVSIEMKKGVDAAEVMEALFSKTKLEVTYGVQMRALVAGKPRKLSLRRALEVWIKHRLEVIERRSRHEKSEAERRAHVLEGLLIAVDAVDRVVSLIRSSKTRESARGKLVKEFKLSEIQADAILALRLASLTGLDVKGLREELGERRSRIRALDEILSSDAVRRRVVREETDELVERYGDARRTEILGAQAAAQRVTRATDQPVRIQLGMGGGIRAQSAGGRAVRLDEETVWDITLPATEAIALFSDQGRFYGMSAGAVLGASATRLASIVEGWTEDERLLLALPLVDLDDSGSIVHVQANGLVKRTELSEFTSPRSGGATASVLREGDRLVAALKVTGEDDILLAAAGGKVIRFKVSDIPVQGRSSRGVVGIKLPDSDRVVSGSVMGGEVWMLTETGTAKRVEAHDFPSQGRGGQGVWLTRPERTGAVVCGVSPRECGTVVLWSSKRALCLESAQMTLAKRSQVGAPILGLEEADDLTNVELVCPR